MAIRTVQRRLVVQHVLHLLNTSWAWGLAGLAVAAALLPLKVVLMAAAVLIVAAPAACIAAAWVSRPSAYEAACRLDEAAGLRDRLSTAWHCRAIVDPNEMHVRQRRDALERAAHTDPRALFAVRIPGAAGRTLALAAAVAALVAYRTNHRPPLVVAVERAVAATGVTQAIQLLRRPEPEVQARKRTLIAGHEEADGTDLDDPMVVPDPTSAGRQAGGSSGGSGAPGSPSGDPADPSSSKSEKSAADDGQPKAGQSGTGPRGGQPLPANAGQGASADVPPQDKDQEESGGGPQANTPARASLAQRIRDALKDLMAKAGGDASKQAANPSQGAENRAPDTGDAKKIPPPPGGQQSQKSPQTPGEGEGQTGESGSSMGANEAGEGDAPSAGRNRPGAVEAAQDAPLDTHPAQDVVPLTPTNFKGEASVLTSNQAGEALVPFRDASPQSTASTNGAEQGNVPLRYRAYVQRYFNHPDEVRR